MEEDFSEQVTDYRVEGRCLHELSDSIWPVLCGLLADCEPFEDICDYACDKEPVLRQLLSLPAGIPPQIRSTAFSAISTRRNSRLASRHWESAIVARLAGWQLIVDGK